jgi:hypothetical protein
MRPTTTTEMLNNDRDAAELSYPTIFASGAACQSLQVATSVVVAVFGRCHGPHSTTQCSHHPSCSFVSVACNRYASCTWSAGALAAMLYLYINRRGQNRSLFLGKVCTEAVVVSCLSGHAPLAASPRACVLRTALPTVASAGRVLGLCGLCGLSSHCCGADPLHLTTCKFSTIAAYWPLLLLAPDDRCWPRVALTPPWC